MKTTGDVKKRSLLGVVLLLMLTVDGLAAAQVCVPPPPGLVSWWPGDGEANDITGGNHGALQNGATFDAGLIRQAFRFLGPDDIVRVSHSSNLNVGTGDVTIDAWIMFDEPIFTNDRIIMSKFSPDVPFPGYTLRWLGDKLQFIIDSEMGGPEPSPPSVQDKKVEATVTKDENWHHVAAVRRGFSMELYYDGELVASATHGSLDDADNSASVGIGNNVGAPDNGFPGLIDELQFFSSALSASEIRAIFKAGSAGKCKVPVTVDIKPGSFPNSVNPRSQGAIPVAILSTDETDNTTTFDAITVDSSTVRFGRTGTEAAPVQSSLEDVDGDGDTDMILHFNTQDAGIVCGVTSASVTGETFGGETIHGSDSVRAVPCR